MITQRNAVLAVLLALAPLVASTTHLLPLAMQPAHPFSLALKTRSDAVETRRATLEAFVSLLHPQSSASFVENRFFPDPQLPSWTISSHTQLTPEGIPIVGADVKVAWNEQNEIVSVTGAIAEGPELARTSSRDVLISSVEALPAACAAVGFGSACQACDSTRAQIVAFAPGVQFGSAGQSRESWMVPCGDDGDVFVDAKTGRSVGVRRLRSHLLIQVIHSNFLTVLWKTGNAFPTNKPAVDGFVNAMLRGQGILKNLTGWESYDGNAGSTISGYIYNSGNDPYFSPSNKGIYLGNGWSSLPTPIWHEYGHAITGATDGLWYEAQSGALSDGFSDIFAMTVDASLNTSNVIRPAHTCPVAGAGNSRRWFVGHDCDMSSCTSTLTTNVTMQGIRDMWDPPCLGDRWNVSKMYCGSSDNMGAHRNCLIPGHLFAVLADGMDGVEGIGVPAAFAIHFRAKLLGNQITTFAQSAAHLRTACSQLVGTNVRDSFGASSIPISAWTCQQLDAAIAHAQFDLPIPCLSAVPEFASEWAVTPRAMMLYADQQDEFAFLASGNFSSAVLYVGSDVSTAVKCDPMVREALHPTSLYNDSNVGWAWWITCPSPNPVKSGVVVGQQSKMTVNLTYGDNGHMISWGFVAFWGAVPVLQSASVGTTLKLVTVNGFNFIKAPYVITTQCGQESYCNGCYVCNEATDNPFLGSCGAFLRTTWVSTNTTSFTMASTITRTGKDVYIYCTQHGNYHYSEALVTKFRYPSATITACLSKKVSGASIVATESVFGAVSCTTDAAGCCVLSLEQKVLYSITTAPQGFSSAQISKTYSKATDWANLSIISLPCSFDSISATEFRQPPSITAVLAGSESVDINVTLPQMLPYRESVSAVFVSPTTKEASSLSLNMEDKNCFFRSASRYSLSTLLSAAKPSIQTTDAVYIALFEIRVSWTEYFTLNGKKFPRSSSASVSVTFRIARQLSLGSELTTLDGGFLWAYLSRGSVVLAPGSQTPAFLDLEIITSANEPGYTIDPSSFRAVSVTGNLGSVSDPVLLSNLTGWVQSWKMRAFIMTASACGTTASDSFTLSYTLVSGSSNSAAHVGTFTAGLGGVESWCSVNQNVSVGGQQQTFSSSTDVVQSLRFFIGDTIHVRDTIVADLPITKVDVVSVSLSGSAISALSGSAAVFSSSQSNKGFTLESCPLGSNSKMVCFSFVLSGADVAASKSLKINTVVSASIEKRNAESPSTTMLSSSFTVAAVRTLEVTDSACTLGMAFSLMMLVIGLLF